MTHIKKAVDRNSLNRLGRVVFFIRERDLFAVNAYLNGDSSAAPVEPFIHLNFNTANSCVNGQYKMDINGHEK